MGAKRVKPTTQAECHGIPAHWGGGGLGGGAVRSDEDEGATFNVLY